MNDLLSKYLVFRIDTEKYAVCLNEVRTVIRVVDIHPVFGTSEFIRGVIHFREHIIPVVDLRTKFGLTEKEYSDRTVYIVVEFRGEGRLLQMAVAVDEVFEVISINNDEIKNTPDIGVKRRSEYLKGIATIHESMVMLLAINKVLSSSEIVQINGLEKMKEKVS